MQPKVDNPLAAFSSQEDTAINMDGSSYYVNYRKLSQGLSEVLGVCLEDTTCLSLDYNADSQTGFLHRILPACADEAGALYLQGDSRGNTFHVKLPEFRREFSFPTPCVFTALDSDVRLP